jgi:hypothetical protein
MALILLRRLAPRGPFVEPASGGEKKIYLEDKEGQTFARAGSMRKESGSAIF